MILSKVQQRDAFITELRARARLDANMVLITNDQGAAPLDGYREELPDQFINSGVSEQNIISVSAGLTLGGKKVFVYSIASFIILRAFEQIKIDLCAMNLPVTIFAVGSGYSYATDGPTHHATEDIAIMRTLENMAIYSPADSNAAAALVDISLNCGSPAYIRLDRDRLPAIYGGGHDFGAGYTTLRQGNDLCILSTGCMVSKALEVADRLENDNISAKVIDLYRLKPLVASGIAEAIGQVKRVVTVEEHCRNGGLGSIIAELLADSGLALPLRRLAIEDGAVFGYGTRDDLHRDRGLDTDGIERSIREWLI